MTPRTRRRRFIFGSSSTWRAFVPEKTFAVCEECGRLAQEFRESNNLLTEAFALPEFGAQFYDEIRNNVLDKITRDGMSSRPRFSHRWIFVSAFALMLIASAVMFVRW